MNTKKLSNNATKIFVVIIIVVSVGALGLQAKDNSAVQSQPKNHNQPTLTPVESKYVCMVTNKLFQKEQIPVSVEGKTYYGCCEMCKGMLANDPKIRAAVDPISGNTLDKATSTIGANAEGDVYYFENEKNLKKYMELVSK